MVTQEKRTDHMTGRLGIKLAQGWRSSHFYLCLLEGISSLRVSISVSVSCVYACLFCVFVSLFVSVSCCVSVILCVVTLYIFA